MAATSANRQVREWVPIGKHANIGRGQSSSSQGAPLSQAEMAARRAKLAEDERQLNRDMAKGTFLYRCMRQDELDLPDLAQESTAISLATMQGAELVRSILDAVGKGSNMPSSFLHFSRDFAQAWREGQLHCQGARGGCEGFGSPCPSG